MSRASLVFFFCLAFVGPATATYSKAVSFFRSPKSLFASGQAPRADLEKAKRGEMTVNFYLVKKDGREWRLDTNLIARDLDLSTKAIDVKTSEVGTLRRFASPWYEFETDQGMKSWRLAETLVPLPEDLGLALTFGTQSLRKTPDWKAEVVATSAIGQRWKVLSIQPPFVEVGNWEKPDEKGFLEISSVVMKSDFASFTLGPEGWKPFSSREKTDLTRIKGLITRPDIGISLRFIPEANLVPRSIVTIQRGEWIQWAQGDLKGHGRVFWKQKEKVTELSPKDRMTNEEILERPVFSVAFHPSSTQEALVSADGVFHTSDGKNWRRLTFFQEGNLPVAIGKKGELLVGTFRSADGGKTFLPYLRWEDLTQLLEQRQKRTPAQVKISDIKVLESEKVQITLDTGVFKASLLGSARYGLVTDWKILSETKRN